MQAASAAAAGVVANGPQFEESVETVECEADSTPFVSERSTEAMQGNDASEKSLPDPEPDLEPDVEAGPEPELETQSKAGRRTCGGQSVVDRLGKDAQRRMVEADERRKRHHEEEKAQLSFSPKLSPGTVKLARQSGSTSPTELFERLAQNPNREDEESKSLYRSHKELEQVREQPRRTRLPPSAIAFVKRSDEYEQRRQESLDRKKREIEEQREETFATTGKPEWDVGPLSNPPVPEAIPPVTCGSKKVNATEVGNRLYNEAATLEARKARKREETLEKAKLSEPFRPSLPPPRSSSTGSLGRASLRPPLTEPFRREMAQSLILSPQELQQRNEAKFASAKAETPTKTRFVRRQAADLQLREEKRDACHELSPGIIIVDSREIPRESTFGEAVDHYLRNPRVQVKPTPTFVAPEQRHSNGLNRVMRAERHDIFADLLTEARKRMVAAAYTKGSSATRLFRHYDRDKDGELSFLEWKTALRRDGKVKPSMMQDRDIRATFRIVDLDGDGGIGLQDFRAFLRPGIGADKQSKSVLARMQQRRLLADESVAGQDLKFRERLRGKKMSELLEVARAEGVDDSMLASIATCSSPRDTIINAVIAARTRNPIARRAGQKQKNSTVEGSPIDLDEYVRLKGGMPARVHVICPRSKAAGDEVTVVVSDGRKRIVEIPEGLTVGSTFEAFIDSDYAVDVESDDDTLSTNPPGETKRVSVAPPKRSNSSRQNARLEVKRAVATHSKKPTSPNANHTLDAPSVLVLPHKRPKTPRENHRLDDSQTSLSVASHHAVVAGSAGKGTAPKAESFYLMLQEQRYRMQQQTQRDLEDSHNNKRRSASQQALQPRVQERKDHHISQRRAAQQLTLLESLQHKANEQDSVKALPQTSQSAAHAAIKAQWLAISSSSISAAASIESAESAVELHLYSVPRAEREHTQRVVLQHVYTQMLVRRAQSLVEASSNEDAAKQLEKEMESVDLDAEVSRAAAHAALAEVVQMLNIESESDSANAVTSEPGAGPIAGTVWELVPDEDGDLYFNNMETGETTWDEPAEVAAARRAPGSTSGGSDDTDEAERLRDHMRPAVQQELEDEPASVETGAGPIAGTVWELVPDEDGDLYFNNMETGETTWDEPAEVAAARRAPGSTSGGSLSPHGHLQQRTAPDSESLTRGGSSGARFETDASLAAAGCMVSMHSHPSLSLSLRTDASDLSSEDLGLPSPNSLLVAAAVDGDCSGVQHEDVFDHDSAAVKPYSPSSALAMSPGSSTGSPGVLPESPEQWRCLWCTVGASDTEGKHVGPDGPETLCDLCGRNYRRSKLKRAASTVARRLPLPPGEAAGRSCAKDASYSIWIQCPEEASSGSVLLVEVDGKDIEVQVPPGVGACSSFEYVLHDGKALMAEVATGSVADSPGSSRARMLDSYEEAAFSAAFSAASRLLLSSQQRDTNRPRSLRTHEPGA